MANSYDVVFIGAGHNALVCAAYLARAGKSVCVLERRELIGGACVSEELWPGYKVSTAAYVNSLLRPEIIKELELHKFGFELLPRSPSSFSPFPDGRSLMMGPDKEMTHREVSKFSRKDADALPRYEAMLERCADLIEPTLMQTPPSPWNMRPADMVHLGKMAWKFKKMGPEGAAAIEILTGAARPILDRWFESENLKVTLATDAVIGAMAAPSMPGTAYVLFHHVMGECNGVRGVWGYVRGGMGGISNSIAGGGEVEGRRDSHERGSREGARQGRTRGRRRAQGRNRDSREQGRLGRRRERDLPQALRREGSARGLRRRREGTRLLERESQDQRRAERASELHVGSGRAGRPAASRHDPHLARHGLHRARVRRCEVREAGARIRFSSARFRR